MPPFAQFRTLDKTLQLRPFLLCYIFLVSCSAGKKFSKHTPDLIAKTITSVESIYAKDKRTTVFNVAIQGNVLKGETSSEAAKAELIRQIAATGRNIVDSIIVLPSADLNGKTKALVNVSVANMRVHPDHKAELATQATMGTPLKVLKKQRGWYLVQTPDKYIGWVEAGGIQVLDNELHAKWSNANRIIFIDPYGIAYADENGIESISDLVYGDIMMEQSKTSNGLLQVSLPDGRQAYVDAKQCMNFSQWQKSREPTTTNLVSAAKRLIGIPYLWGGTSFKAVDCSGFTKTVYFMNGLVLPRDASQQVELGIEIDTSNNWQQLQPGDLLFFGSRANEKRPERVVHVGIWLGNKEFIHASGLVQIGSFDPSAANYDANETRRFLRAKRISPEAALYDLRTTIAY